MFQSGRNLLPLLSGLLIGLWGAGESVGQVVTSQTVQLPTFHYFGVSTTVVVPDRGWVTLEGNGGSAFSSAQYGPLGGRAYGRSRWNNGASVSATIIDHQALDHAVLAEAARRRSAPVAREEAGGVNRQAKLMADYWRRGQEMEAAGQPEVARVFYQRLLKSEAKSWVKLAEERLATLENPPQRNLANH
jgi:hypothetical protein